MAEIASVERAAWALMTLLNGCLVLLLLYRRNHRNFFFFFVYALTNLLQAPVLFESYRIWGFNSSVSFKIFWATQALVAAARTLAVAEICWRILANYRGIWALGWRLFLGMAAVVLVHAWVIGGHNWPVVALNADRSLWLAIGVAILTLFLFTQHFEVPFEPAPRFLAIGFFLYACFQVLNDTVAERWLKPYAALWDFLGTLAFLASLLVWIWAMRPTEQPVASAPELLPEHLYRSLSPAINSRLKALNEQLGHFWHAEGKKT